MYGIKILVIGANWKEKFDNYNNLYKVNYLKITKRYQLLKLKSIDQLKYF